MGSSGWCGRLASARPSDIARQQISHTRGDIDFNCRGDGVSQSTMVANRKVDTSFGPPDGWLKTKKLEISREMKNSVGVVTVGYTL